MLCIKNNEIYYNKMIYFCDKSRTNKYKNKIKCSKILQICFLYKTSWDHANDGLQLTHSLLCSSPCRAS